MCTNHNSTIAARHDYARQAFNLAQKNVKCADTKDLSFSALIYIKHNALRGDETSRDLRPTLKCIQEFWLGQSEKTLSNANN